MEIYILNTPRTAVTILKSVTWWMQLYLKCSPFLSRLPPRAGHNVLNPGKMIGDSLSLAGLLAIVKADFYRYDGAGSLGAVLRCYVMEPGARYTLWLRCCGWARGRTLLSPIYAVFWIIRRHYEFKFGFSIPVSTSIGAGLYFSHFG